MKNVKLLRRTDTKNEMDLHGKKRFVRYKTGAEIYDMSQSSFEDLADDAGAKYKIGKMVLVNCEIFEAYLETFHIGKDTKL